MRLPVSPVALPDVLPLRGSIYTRVHGLYNGGRICICKVRVLPAERRLVEEVGREVAR